MNIPFCIVNKNWHCFHFWYFIPKLFVAGLFCGVLSAHWRFVSEFYWKNTIWIPVTILQRKFLSFFNSLTISVQCWILSNILSWVSLCSIEWVQSFQDAKCAVEMRYVEPLHIPHSIFQNATTTLAGFLEHCVSKIQNSELRFSYIRNSHSAQTLYVIN